MLDTVITVPLGDSTAQSLCKYVLFLREILEYSAPTREFIVYEVFPSKNDPGFFCLFEIPNLKKYSERLSSLEGIFI